MGESPTRSRVVIDDVPIDAITAEQTVHTVMAELAAGRGGRIVTPNVDIMQAIRRRKVGPEVYAAELVVADGMPLLWAAQVRGTPLPERVTGASLVWDLSAAAAQAGYPVFLLGAGPGIAQQAAQRFTACYPGLRIAGTYCPPAGFDTDEEQLSQLATTIRDSAARLVFVALGFPKQERVSARLQRSLPDVWFLGCGGALDMAAGHVERAHPVLQKVGAEWLHRLIKEPRRLAKRYLIDDVPYAVAMLGRAAADRRSGAAATPPTTASPQHGESS